MNGSRLTALVVTGDRRWGCQCVDRLLAAGCDVHTASDGLRGIDLLRKQRYDLIVVDDALSDVSPLEFTLNLRELVPNAPVYIVAGDQVDRLPGPQRVCETFFAGVRTDALTCIEAAVEEAARRAAGTAPAPLKGFPRGKN